MKISILFMLLLCCPISCSKQQHVDSNLCDESHMELAFKWLERDNREGAYVIIEDPKNGKYLQFGIMLNDWIHFDIPNYTTGEQEFEPDHDWKHVKEFSHHDLGNRRNYMEPAKAKLLWSYALKEDFKPYYFRSVYETDGTIIASNESVCFNVPRGNREKCVKVASEVFEIIHGYSAPVVLNMTSNITTWSRPDD